MKTLLAMALSLLVATALFLTGCYFNWFSDVNVEQLADLGGFFGGVFGPLIGLGTIIFLWVTIQENRESTEKQLKAVYDGNFEMRFDAGIQSLREHSKYKVTDFRNPEADKLNIREALSVFYDACYGDDKKKQNFIGFEVDPDRWTVGLPE